MPESPDRNEEKGKKVAVSSQFSLSHSGESGLRGGRRGMDLTERETQTKHPGEQHFAMERGVAWGEGGDGDEKKNRGGKWTRNDERNGRTRKCPFLDLGLG